ncbi:hypothetical protein GCM10010392_41800 [Streptomyces clavifer]|nr:hypothetical protein GCM10010392_41800 [Streptomyces clavifer]
MDRIIDDLGPMFALQPGKRPPRHCPAPASGVLQCVESAQFLPEHGGERGAGPFCGCPLHGIDQTVGLSLPLRTTARFPSRLPVRHPGPPGGCAFRAGASLSPQTRAQAWGT